MGLGRKQGPSKSELRKNLKQLKAILLEKPLDLDARVRVARTFRLLGKPRDAIQHYRAVARYLALAGQPLQAIAVLKELLQVDPKHEETLLFLAKIYARTRGAVPSNVGRVAVPIDDGGMPTTMAGGWPMTDTGLWRAIKPQEPQSLARELSAEEAGAKEALVDDVALQLGAVENITGSSEPIFALAGDDADPDISDEIELDEDDVLSEAEEAELAIDAPELIEISEDELIGELSVEELAIPRVPLFSTLSQRAFVELAQEMVHRRAGPGEHIFDMGESGDSIFVISRGRVNVYRHSAGEDRLIETLGEGEFMGLLAFISPRGRAATLITEGEVEYFEIERRVMQKLIARHPTIEKGVYRFVRHRLLMSLLAEMPVLRAFPAKDREAIARRFKQRSFSAGEELIYEGAELNAMILLLRGSIAAGREGRSGDVENPVVQLEPGDLVGCLAAQNEEGCDAAVQAQEDGICAIITHKIFEDLSIVYPALRGLREGLDDERCMISAHLFSVAVGLSADRFVLEDDT